MNYKSKFKNKKNLLDVENFGNFHEQLGQYLNIIKRQSPPTWWLNQKFSDDMTNLRNNLYYAIQGRYLEKYFHDKFSSTTKIIDIGCGIGYYSNMMARSGASVLGIDPNEKYIEIAKKNAQENVSFRKTKIGSIGAMDFIPTNSIDFVFMSDALLFYFVPISSTEKASIQILFDDIHRILKPNGMFVSVEPHYLFWLLPWLGDIDRPFTIITEYYNKSFGVTPNMSQLIKTFTKNGFYISWMDEMFPDPEFKSIDQRAYYFARQFPLWQIFELQPRLEKS